MSAISTADHIFQILWMRCNIFHNLILHRTLKMYYHSTIFFNCWYSCSFSLNNILFIHILNLALKILYQMKIGMMCCFQKVLATFPEYPMWIWSGLLSSRHLDERKISLSYRKGHPFSHPLPNSQINKKSLCCSYCICLALNTCTVLFTGIRNLLSVQEKISI